MVDEQDIGGWVETGDGVEWDVDGVVERDTAAEEGWTGKICGVENPSKICGVAVANISKVNGI